MKLNQTLKITTAVILMALVTSTAHAAKKNPPKGGGGDGGGGTQNALVSLESDSPYIPYVESQSFDNKGQVVLYGKMDLLDFEGSYNSGISCIYELTYDDLTDGIFVIYPISSTNPAAVEMTFRYNGFLDNDEQAAHILTMTGSFDEPDNWPPTVDDPETTLTFNYWGLAAENRKAQRKDCERSYAWGGEWTVTVSLVQ
jgi:hypothetical protein